MFLHFLMRSKAEQCKYIHFGLKIRSGILDDDINRKASF